MLDFVIGGERLYVRKSEGTVLSGKPDGSLWLAGRAIKKEQLTQRLKAIRSAQNDNVEVRIRGSKLAPYSSVEPIMLACTQSGIWKVSYAVYGKEQ